MASDADESQESFETRVSDAVRSVVNDYCDAVASRWSRSEITNKRPHIKVTVRTVRPVMKVRDQVWTLVSQAVAADLPGAVLDGVFYAIRPDTGSPGYDVVVSPSVDLMYTDQPDSGRSAQALRLLLAYSDASWRFHLSSMDEWVPVGRDIDGRIGNGSIFPAIQVPRYASMVPRGSLLLIKHWQGNVWWRRSEHRPHYTVSIDDKVLSLGEHVPSRPDGTITYLGSTKRTIVTYRLTYAPSDDEYAGEVFRR